MHRNMLMSPRTRTEALRGDYYAGDRARRYVKRRERSLVRTAIKRGDL